jgi:hypothetical protein
MTTNLKLLCVFAHPDAEWKMICSRDCAKCVQGFPGLDKIIR